MSSLVPEIRTKIREWILSVESIPVVSDVVNWVSSSFGIQLHEDTARGLIREAEAARDETWIKLPGFGMPLGAMPSPEDRFPILIGDQDRDFKAVTLTIRELCMLRFIEEITNKPEWWIKVFDDDISAKWQKEAVEMNWGQYIAHGDFSQSMAEACIKELRAKAELYEKTGLIPVADYSMTAIKSDKLIAPDLKEALKHAAAVFENVPEAEKDWHPGSDNRVLDLVHPSLWPLVYGRSRIMPNKRITLEDCLKHCGMGVTIPVQKREDARTDITYKGDFIYPETLSERFQWLPCDINLIGEHPKIESYINNAHPVKHAALYPVIEKIIEKALPAWDVIYRWPEEFPVQRVVSKEVTTTCKVPEICNEGDRWGCHPNHRPLNEGEDPRVEDEEYQEWYVGSERHRLDHEWFWQTHDTPVPDPTQSLESMIRLKPDDVKITGFFKGASHIQVIVKLANIHLTPENPTYGGGSWHMEGQINEHIVGTALYYYDCDNISDSRLDFRTAANADDLSVELGYEQDDHTSIQHTFAIRSQDDTLQDIGSVLTREDRMLFFPNVYLHHVSPFQLVDKTRPGHRKILALFLVDPAIPVISTANVPPQQRDWWMDTAVPASGLAKLPQEVMDMVVENMDLPIGEKEAKEIRLELMKERSNADKETTERLRNVDWNFCEH